MVINLIGEPKGLLRQPPRNFKNLRRLMPMVAYPDLFQFVIMLCAVVTLVVVIRKK